MACFSLLTGSLVATACGSSSSGPGGGSDGGSGGASGFGASSTAGASAGTSAGASAGTNAGASAGTNAGGSTGVTAGSTTGTNSGGSTGGTFTSSIPAGTPLNTLTPSQLQTLCSEGDAFLAPYRPTIDDFGCRLEAVFLAGLGASTDAEARTACQQFYDQCKASGSTSTTMCNAPAADCMATVGELTACINDQAPLFSSALNSLPSCSTLTLADLQSDGGITDGPPTPPSCATYQQKCPGALGMSTMGGTGGTAP
jgi:hypothetical protein